MVLLILRGTMTTVSARNSFSEDNWELKTQSFGTDGSISKATGGQIPARGSLRTSSDDENSPLAVHFYRGAGSISQGGPGQVPPADSARNSVNDWDWELTSKYFGTVRSISKAANSEKNNRSFSKDFFTAPTKLVPDLIVARTGTPRGRIIVHRPGSTRVYIDEPNWSISLKCLGVTIAAPFYTMGTMAGNIITILGRTYAIIGEKYNNDKKIQKSSGSSIERIKNLSDGLFDIARCPVIRVGKAVRSFFFGIAMFGKAFYGIFSPLAGRSYIVDLESKWHGGDYYMKGIYRMPKQVLSFRTEPPKDKTPKMEFPPLARIFRQLILERKAFFLSAYLQPLPGNPNKSDS